MKIRVFGLIDKVSMFKCHVCGFSEGRTERVNEVFDIDGQHVLVENIPATICARCGEATFSRETTEKIRRMVHGEALPLKSVPLNVLHSANASLLRVRHANAGIAQAFARRENASRPRVASAAD